MKNIQIPIARDAKPAAYKRPERHIKRVDFQRIEEAPLNKFEREVQKKIAVGPNPLEVAIKKEEKELLKKALQKAIRRTQFSAREGSCLKLTLKGYSPIEIAEALKILSPSVHLHLRRAVEKIKKKTKEKQLKDGLLLSKDGRFGPFID